MMAPEPKSQEPNIPPKRPDVQPEPKPNELPQDILHVFGGWRHHRSKQLYDRE